MSDQYSAFTVVLENNVSEEEAQALMAAIQQLKGVLSVTGKVADFTEHLAYERARRELGLKMLEVLRQG